MLDFLIEIIGYLFLETAVRLPGYYLVRCFRKESEVKFDDPGVLLVGLLLWVVIIAALVAFWLV